MSAKSQPTETQISAFYRAALIGLRFLDDTQDRANRFGPDADARWASFQGHLHAGDRINILCRDAAVTYGPAFAPSIVFDTEGVAPDEAFGPDWECVEDRLARKLWAAAEAQTRHDGQTAIAAAAEALGITTTPVDGTIAELDAASKVLVGGMSAIAAVATAFAGDPALRWAEQVTVVADTPAARQLAGLAAVFLKTDRATTLVAPSDAPDATARIVSADASDAVAGALRGQG